MSIMERKFVILYMQAIYAKNWSIKINHLFLVPMLYDKLFKSGWSSNGDNFAIVHFLVHNII